MIVPMKRVHLVLLERERATSLRELRALGVLHLETITGRGPDHDELTRSLAEIDRALGTLSGVKNGPAEGLTPPVGEGRELAREVNRAVDRNRALQEEIASLAKEQDRLRDWGDFELETLRSLAAGHLGLLIAEGSARSLPEIASLDYVRLASPKGRVRVALLEPPSTLPGDFVPFAPPARAPREIRDRIAEARSEIRINDDRLNTIAAAAAVIRRTRETVAQALVLETVRSGIEQAGPVCYLSGWVPAEDAPRLQAEARGRGWGLLTDDPGPDDQPPTKVKNPAAVRMISPVFQFLGTVPGYREYDISVWFLIFFSLYFAMIFGDGGYGVVMLLGGLVAAVKTKASGKRLSDAVRLLLLLALTTVGWGLVTATWFALPVDRLPGFLVSLSLPPFRAGNPDADTNIKIFCFVVGAVQLALAHLKNIRRDFPNPKFIAQVGSLAMVVGMFMLVLNLIVDPARFPIPIWAVGLVGGGFLAVFVFGNWEGNLLRALLAGLKGIIPTFLGTVSVFADIVSYIRLWAVGLAGLAISQTVNSMAGGAFGEPAGRVVAFVIGAVMGVILLAAGHGLNLVMSVLSVVVHGIRLNMLEFSGHLGMEWSGYLYDPFRQTTAARDTDGKEIS